MEENKWNHVDAACDQFTQSQLQSILSFFGYWDEADGEGLPAATIWLKLVAQMRTLVEIHQDSHPDLDLSTASNVRALLFGWLRTGRRTGGPPTGPRAHASSSAAAAGPDAVLADNVRACLVFVSRALCDIWGGHITTICGNINTICVGLFLPTNCYLGALPLLSPALPAVHLCNPFSWLYSLSFCRTATC